MVPRHAALPSDERTDGDLSLIDPDDDTFQSGASYPAKSPPPRQGSITTDFDSGVGSSLPRWFVAAINRSLNFFTQYRLSEVGTLLQGPTKNILHGITMFPASCAAGKADRTKS